MAMMNLRRLDAMVSCRSWTNRMYVCIGMWFKLNVLFDAVWGVNLKLISLNVWNRVVLALHDQYVRLYCCGVCALQPKVITRCSMQYKAFISSSCAVQNTLQWQWRQYDLRWMYGTAVSWLLTLSAQSACALVCLYCCAFKFEVFDEIQYVWGRNLTFMCCPNI